ncbi:hypothetical protein SODALDRAFT_187031 [Sodiomyces alkalinus F11]|uniref:Uncharacterized protein n=1 Tax=Sodiomyces alkalinus (strain CBS 110278 / VKM F-3762 / F11) TaxID=1314773 RepID=A0A3N2PV30_SODAK|nr:hypothetical protein SODALDRAFT_187031 [Sodiomyces alkalinus F11]ROT38349.1 hypothetical protein SODALDRAFT_187031 [Sodiomyces alkalinus F11]
MDSTGSSGRILCPGPGPGPYSSRPPSLVQNSGSCRESSLPSRCRWVIGGSYGASYGGSYGGSSGLTQLTTTPATFLFSSISFLFSPPAPPFIPCPQRSNMYMTLPHTSYGASSPTLRTCRRDLTSPVPHVDTSIYISENTHLFQTYTSTVHLIRPLSASILPPKGPSAILQWLLCSPTTPLAKQLNTTIAHHKTTRRAEREEEKVREKDKRQAGSRNKRRLSPTSENKIKQ